MSSTLDLVIESERLRLVAVSEAYAEAIFSEFTAEITELMGPKPPDALEYRIYPARVRFAGPCKSSP